MANNSAGQHGVGKGHFQKERGVLGRQVYQIATMVLSWFFLFRVATILGEDNFLLVGI